MILAWWRKRRHARIRMIEAHRWYVIARNLDSATMSLASAECLDAMDGLSAWDMRKLSNATRGHHVGSPDYTNALIEAWNLPTPAPSSAESGGKE